MGIETVLRYEARALSDTETLKAAAVFLHAHGIEMAPVVDEAQSLSGFFSREDIVRAIRYDISFDTEIGKIITWNKGLKNGDGSPHDISGGTSPFGLMDAIVNASGSMVIVTDPDLTIRFVSRSVTTALKTESQILLGQKLSVFLNQADISGDCSAGDKGCTHKIDVGERSYISMRCAIEHEGRILGFLIRFKEILRPEPVAGELASAKELNRELHAIIESSSDGIYVCDGEANVLRINRAYREITELDTSDFYGRNMRDLVKEGIYSESVTLKVLENSTPVSIVQKTSTGKSLLATGNPIFNDDGSVFRVVTSVRDITELYSLQLRLEETRRISEQYMKELQNLRVKRVRNVEGMVIGSDEMEKVVEMAMRFAGINATVLITGESGTGKEMVADIIHKHSERADRPCIKVNCGAIPKDLMESEFFGYEEGAFTGARKGGRAGYFSMAEGGTLFLDEIGELPYDLQAKLLRILQSRELMRIGGRKSSPVDVRIIAATNKNLEAMVAEKSFREDLYYRINVFPLHIPALQERPDDIQFLAAHFLRFFNKNYGTQKRLSPDVLDHFERYSWPGNIRELQNLIERLVVIAPDDLITAKDLPCCFSEPCGAASADIAVKGLMPLKDALESVEKQLIRMAYDNFATTRDMAEYLRISAASVVRKAAKYGIRKK
ncbi:PAS domain S-box-containing protein [Desulfobotulus alkaliphilus]|uniref:HTH-type transcriptional regulatory protein TyrR n=1 Tax=Desulfobotulus alkaliphilus TaxID=622671 RepID=A0A562S2K5_9BACT|nr:sigma 54-interacting transcriptional regulator [Desulfobotulus alkaliphilus]TWI75313.1 PAS domain S-box-containing protein [Desulfobotulus alkaliphilus]